MSALLVIRHPEKYAATALATGADAVRQAAPGVRNDTLNRHGFTLFSLAAAGVMPFAEVETVLGLAAAECGLDRTEVLQTLASARRAGEATPADVRIDAPRPPTNGTTPPGPLLWRFTSWPGMRSPDDGRSVETTSERLLAALRAPSVPADMPKHDLPFWAFADFQGGKRAKTTFERAHALTLDYDALADLTLDTIRSAFTAVAHLAHTSPSHRPETPKWRVVIALSRPVDMPEWERLWDWSQTVLPGADPTSRQPYRGYFVPVARPDYACALYDAAPPLDVDAVLAVPPAPRGAPDVVINGRQMLDVIDDAWAAVLAKNCGPTYFCRGGALTRLRTLDSKLPTLHALTLDEATGLLLRSARWVKIVPGDNDDGPKKKDCVPPREVAHDFLAYPAAGLPPIDSVVASPVVSAQGKILAAPGYHKAAALWYARPPGFSSPAVPPRPGPEVVRSARSLLLDELLCDFPFASPADRAHAVAAILLPFVRRLIPGPTPLHLVSAPTPGSGKGLFAALVGLVATARVPDSRTLSESDDETRKMLIAELLRGHPIILLDNANERWVIRSSALASAVTAETFTDRLLGASVMVSAPNRALWLLTANNPKLTLEIARRCVRIRLLPAVDQPWLRKDFRHWPLLPWAQDNRPPLVHACLVLAQAWIAAGRPAASAVLGSFESWAQTMGGILDVAGIPGFLANLEALYAEADSETDAWRAFVAAWTEEHGPRWATVAALVELADVKGLLPAILGDGTSRSQQTRLGRALSRMHGRVLGDAQIVVGHDRRTKTARYRLTKPGATPPAENEEMFP